MDTNETEAPTFPHEDGGSDGEQRAAASTVLLVSIMFLCILVSYFLRQSTKVRHFVPESAASMLIGIVAGFFASLILSSEDMRQLEFQPQVFFFLLLPPIVFDAGFSIKKRLFFDNLTSILLFAVFGTIISTFVVGLLTYLSAKAGAINIDISSPMQSLVFGALISSVDPVATLSIMGDPSVGVDPLLYSLVFGESVLNDAVAIVLFRVFTDEAARGEDFRWEQLGIMMGHFFTVAIGSLILGGFVGLTCSFGFKNAAKLREYPVMEVQLLFLTAFGSFALGELLSLSGVTSLFTTGLALSHYNFHNLSQESKISSLYVFESMAKTAETLVFVSLGLSLFAAPMEWDAGFFFLALLFCVIGRALNVFPLAFLANLCRENKIPFNAIVLMFFSGLRGSVSFALAMQLDLRDPGVSVVRSTTLLIIIVTTVVLGGTAYKVIDRLDMRAHNGDSGGGTGNAHALLREDFSSYLEMNSNDMRDSGVANGGASHFSSGAAGSQRNTSSSSSSRMVTRFWHRLDDLYMKPVFGGSSESNARRARRTAAALASDPDGDMLNNALWPSRADQQTGDHLALDEGDQTSSPFSQQPRQQS